MKKAMVIMAFVAAAVMLSGCPATSGYSYQNYHPHDGVVIRYDDPADVIRLRQQDERERQAAHRRMMDRRRQAEREAAEAQRQAERDRRDRQRALRDLSRELQNWSREIERSRR